jgi:hypothetical protein
MGVRMNIDAQVVAILHPSRVAMLDRRAAELAGLRPEPSIIRLRALLYSVLHLHLRDDLSVFDLPHVVRDRLAELSRRAIDAIRALAEALALASALALIALEPGVEAGPPPPDPLLAALELAPSAPPQRLGPQSVRGPHAPGGIRPAS